MHIKQEMLDFVLNLLKNQIPDTYYYHNVDHTSYVLEKAIEIGRHENCSDEELKLLSAAALWHDVGYINTYTNHEEESCRLAREHLPGYGYNTDDIETICGMIMATKIPHRPDTKLEAIIADADMEYLGTDKAAEQADKLFRELKHLNPLMTRKIWNGIEIEFLKEHRYFTDWCKKNRVPAKVNYMNNLIIGN